MNWIFSNLGGGTRDRTADLLHAMQALSQLSYTPTREPRILEIEFRLVNRGRVETRNFPDAI
jgi:hypothetical protein